MSVYCINKIRVSQKFLLTTKNTYFAIAYTCLDVSPPIFLLKVNAKNENVRCALRKFWKTSLETFGQNNVGISKNSYTWGRLH